MADPGPTRGPEPADPGVAFERTALAWRRTVLAIVVAAVILARLVVDELGSAGLVAVAVALPVGVLVFWGAGRPSRLPTAANGALVMAAVTALAGVEIAALVAQAAGR